MATATVTVDRLMSLYLMQPSRYQDGDLYIPESGNGKPDLLDEVAFELDWMLTMQRMDGAVYRKLAGPKWVTARKPEEDTDQRYIYGISAPETAKFAASMALAARTYRDISPKDAELYQVAAENAWGWLEKHPNMDIDWQKPDDGGSGKYLSSGTDTEAALEFDDDDRLTAAIELYLTTGAGKYRAHILQHAPDMPYTLFEWKDATALSLWHLLTYDHTPELAALRKGIKEKLLARADDLLDTVASCPLHMANQRLVWGSNKMLAEEGITLLHAWHYTQDERYLTAALDQVDYLFGRNPFALSFVTTAGENAVKTPLHLWGTAIQRTIPGLLVGGPNVLAQDNVAPRDQGIFSYVDNERAYSVNEYAIDYNAAIIGLLETLAIYRFLM
jgi:endoglucanase